MQTQVQGAYLKSFVRMCSTRFPNCKKMLNLDVQYVSDNVDDVVCDAYFSGKIVNDKYDNTIGFYHDEHVYQDNVSAIVDFNALFAGTILVESPDLQMEMSTELPKRLEHLYTRGWFLTAQQQLARSSFYINGVRKSDGIYQQSLANICAIVARGNSFLAEKLHDVFVPKHPQSISWLSEKLHKFITDAIDHNFAANQSNGINFTHSCAFRLGITCEEIHCDKFNRITAPVQSTIRSFAIDLIHYNPVSNESSLPIRMSSNTFVAHTQPWSRKVRLLPVVNMRNVSENSVSQTVCLDLTYVMQGFTYLFDPNLNKYKSTGSSNALELLLRELSKENDVVDVTDIRLSPLPSLLFRLIQEIGVNVDWFITFAHELSQGRYQDVPLLSPFAASIYDSVYDSFFDTSHNIFVNIMRTNLLTQQQTLTASQEPFFTLPQFNPQRGDSFAIEFNLRNDANNSAKGILVLQQC